ncbi:MAG TPA: FG-GAP-like repeat-containing protein, partial [Herpetosiphonaceae bacterium]
ALNLPTRIIKNYENGNPETVTSNQTTNNWLWTDGTDTDLITEIVYNRDQVSAEIGNYVPNNGTFSLTKPITNTATAYEYDDLGRVTKVTVNEAAISNPPPGMNLDHLNRVTETRYHPEHGQVQAERDSLGRWTVTKYDDDGQPTKTITNCRTSAGVPDPELANCAVFDAQNKPDQNVPTTTSYDAWGQVEETQDALGHITRREYTLRNQVRTLIRNYVLGATPDADTNVTTQTDYDLFGRPIQVTDELGQVTTTRYTALGRPQRIVTPQSTTTLTYDALGRLVGQVDSVSGTTESGFDGQGNLRWERAANGALTFYQLDGLGRVTAAIAGYANGVVEPQDGATADLITSTEYDRAGRALSVTEPGGRVTAYRYSLTDQLVAVIENVAYGPCPSAPCNVWTRYRYDRAGNRTAVIDANGAVRHYTYDTANQQTSATDGSGLPGRQTGWTYDKLGRLVSQDDPRGDAYDVTYEYNGLDQQTKVRTINNSNLTVESRYDALGRRTQLIDATGTTSFGYDDLNRLETVTAPNTGVVGYGYNARGERTRVTYPDTSALTYQYTFDGQLDLVKQGATVLADYGYEPQTGLLSSVARANGVATSYQYDLHGRVSQIRHAAGATELNAFTYATNRQGERIGVSETRALAATALPFGAATLSGLGVSPQGMAAGDLNGDGTQDLVAVNQGANSVSVRLGQGDGSFTVGTTLTVGLAPRALALGDLNRDNKLDLVVANRDSHTISIRLGNGNGTFGNAPVNERQSAAAANGAPQGVALGDFNRDGSLDIAVANSASNVVSVFPAAAAADGSFGAPVDYATNITPVFVAAADVDSDGAIDLAIAHALSNPVMIRYNNGTGGFSTSTNHAVSSASFALAVGDLSGDGRQDLVTANYGTGTLSVLRGAGNRTFLTASEYVVGANPTFVTIADLNRDGKQDLAVANSGAATLTLLPGHSDGTFADAATLAAAAGPITVLAADLNNDGHQDLAATASGANALAVLLNQAPARGGFARPELIATGDEPAAVVLSDLDADNRPELLIANRATNTVTKSSSDHGRYTSSLSVAVAPQPRAIVTGDFNHDGRRDAAVVSENSQGAAGTVTLLLSTIIYPFVSPPPTYAVGARPVALDAGDINGDTYLDIAVANAGGNSVSLLLGTAAGPLQAGTTVPVGTDPSAVLLRDFDRDGKLDLAVTNKGSNTLTTYRGSGTGTFTALQTVPVSPGPVALDAGDANGDAYLDLAVASTTQIGVLGGTAAGSFAMINPITIASAPAALRFTDANIDGRQDLVVGWAGTEPASVLYGLGNAAFQAPQPIAAGAKSASIAAGDINGDSLPDLAIANQDTDTVAILLNQTIRPTFGAQLGQTGQTSPAGIAAGDLNNDGRQDLVVTNFSNHTITALLGAADGGFQTPVVTASGNNPRAVALGDLNRDGKLDAAVANRVDSKVTILLGQGNGSFVAASGSPHTVGSQPYTIAIGDLNRDGKLDVVTANASSSNITILYGSGSGTIASTATANVGPIPNTVLVADVTGDGKADVITANENGNSISVVQMNASGAPVSPATTYAVGVRPYGLAVGDVNRDGKQDVVTVNNGDNTASLLLGQANGTLAAAKALPVGATPLAVTLGDLNNDGAPEILATTSGGTGYVTLWNNGGGVFGAPVRRSTGNGPMSIVSADFTGDGLNDVAVSHNGSNMVGLIPTTALPANAFKLYAQANTGASPRAVAAADLNGDGKQDLVAANFSDSTITSMLGDGNGSYQPAVTQNIGNAPRGLALGDIDLDGIVDMVVANSGANGVSFHYGVGDGTFTGTGGGGSHTTGAQPWAVALGDLDRDGKLDVVTANAGAGANSVSVLYGSGDRLSPISGVIATHTVGAVPVSVQITDVTGDGYGDIITANNSGNSVTILPTNSIRNAMPMTTLAVGTGPYAVIARDFNGDSLLDLATANMTGNSVSVLLAKRAGGFTAAFTQPVAGSPMSLAAADYNADGAPDLAVALNASSGVTILPGTGSGAFRAGVEPIFTGANPAAVIAADLNGDGDPDFVSANSGQNTLSTYLNRLLPRAGASGWTYGYDGLGRLAMASERGGATYGYAYDRVGNRTEAWVNGKLIEQLSYNGANQTNRYGYEYDAAGNLTRDPNGTYEYDVLGRLTATVNASGRASNAYNGDGVLVSTTTNGILTRYAQDLGAPLSRVLATTQGGTTKNYWYGEELLAEHSDEGAQAEQNTTAQIWYLQDALGSVRHTTSAQGTLLGDGRYDPWGQQLGATGAPFGFTGEIQNPNSSLTYLRARWYNPSRGTLMGRDPFAGLPKNPYSLHAYQYGYSNPLSHRDPTGKNPGACLIPAAVDGPLPVGDVGTIACFIGYGIYALFLTGGTMLTASQIQQTIQNLPNISRPQHTGQPLPQEVYQPLPQTDYSGREFIPSTLPPFSYSGTTGPICLENPGSDVSKYTQLSGTSINQWQQIHAYTIDLRSKYTMELGRDKGQDSLWVNWGLVDDGLYNQLTPAQQKMPGNYGGLFASAVN